MTALLWLISGACGAFFVYVAVLNWYIFYLQVLCGRNVSWAPFIGGAAGAISVLSVPIGISPAWVLLPLLLDWGSIPGLVATLSFHLIRKLYP